MVLVTEAYLEGNFDRISKFSTPEVTSYFKVSWKMRTRDISLSVSGHVD